MIVNQGSWARSNGKVYLFNPYWGLTVQERT